MHPANDDEAGEFRGISVLVAPNRTEGARWHGESLGTPQFLWMVWQEMQHNNRHLTFRNARCAVAVLSK